MKARWKCLYSVPHLASLSLSVSPCLSVRLAGMCWGLRWKSSYYTSACVSVTHIEAVLIIYMGYIVALYIGFKTPYASEKSFVRMSWERCITFGTSYADSACSSGFVVVLRLICDRAPDFLSRRHVMGRCGACEPCGWDSDG